VSDTFRILVTGSRDFDDSDMLSLQLGMAVGDGRRTGRPVIVVHGDCPTGADRMADTLAEAHGIARDPRPADWQAPCRPECRPGHRRRKGRGPEYCPAAGNYRNQEMVDTRPDVVLAFFKKGAANSGTSDCVRRAEKAKVPVRRFTA